ncbi:MAG: DUF3179 domain-containing protein [Nitrospirae bacterium]|nr:DUF3179 domain-containing protein [Nitrospirota bacterium]
MQPVKRTVVIGLAAGGLLLGALGFSLRSSGEFDLSKHNVPLDQIVSGGPGKDGIPALLKPVFVPVREANFLKDEERILGLSRGSEAKAYPIKILNWHEIVNDTIGGKPVVVTYCPLCGTGIGFEASVQGRPHTFGVSGLLYQSDLLMYDHQTQSLWSQISMEAVAGPLTGAKLKPVFLTHTTWEEWRGEHPATLVLSTQTGYSRDYNRDPYLGYAQSAELMFDTRHFDPRYHPKEWVLGIEVKGAFKAYPFAELKKVKGPLTDQINGQKVRILFNPRAQSASVTDADGRPMPSVMAFWFAWYAFHPGTQVFTANH